MFMENCAFVRRADFPRRPDWRGRRLAYPYGAMSRCSSSGL